MLADRYELDHEIGRGGMGTVWLARDVVLHRVVAVKQIGMGPGGGEPDLQRAEREAHLAARINHQNVVAVFDLVDEGGHQWLVMEHVDGPSLAGLIAERGALDPAEVAPIVEQVAAALAAAHEHGIVHRDVKPSNILLTHDGVAKLSDFGVARAQADASLTQTGLVTGSPAYLSPEVASGRTATAASDVWSLGATVFHALAGGPPYEVGDNLLGTMYRIVNEAPPTLEAGGPLAALVAAMMQHDPDARPTMAAVEEAVSTQSGVELDLESTQAMPAATAVARPTATTAFRPLEPPVEPAVPPVAPAVAAKPTPAATAPGRRASPTRSRTPWLITAGAVAALIAVVSFVGLRGGSADDAPRAAGERSSAGSGSASTEDEPAPAGDGEVTAEQMEGFAADYLSTASNDPDAGFTMLTPGYQRASNGIEGYKGFWEDVADLSVERVSADPASLRVSYTYSYDFKGDRRTEAVTLQLEKSGDSFLIAGAT
ncbi:serine/threonine-protein kinase [Aeromicrobium yanjiei]|uniref:non-specific serine/threonine protein kinase n=1 Tax=Aeromicrobium yanjiei TaxID=2662028 RepID=A0A5Q2MHY1_9ACTN|nr:serine/threonine-protein kinase [Aeromicrobium yanjiei]QGG40656.1 protein kinase [Aeromicrobium yanjiei]